MDAQPAIPLQEARCRCPVVGRIASGLDECAKTVSLAGLELFGIVKDRFATMPFEDDRPTYRAKVAERAIFATFNLLKSQMTPHPKSPCASFVPSS
jgi:hypothetical protein